MRTKTVAPETRRVKQALNCVWGFFPQENSSEILRVFIVGMKEFTGL